MSAVDLWLDDLRPAPDGWLWAKTYAEAIEILQNRTVNRCSLDHDLGELFSGYDVVKFMAENDIWPIQKPTVHSMNPVGAASMKGTIERYGPY